MNDIEWNKVTWYSKIVAVIIFLLIVPGIAFYMGRQYQMTLEAYNLVVQPQEESGTSLDTLPNVTGGNTAAAGNVVLSGINGLATIGPVCPVEQPGNSSCNDKPLSTRLVVRDSMGKLITETVSGSDGKFFVVVAPGSYTVEAAAGATLPRANPVTLTVTKGSFTKVAMVFDSGIR